MFYEHLVYIYIYIYVYVSEFICAVHYSHVGCSNRHICRSLRLLCCRPEALSRHTRSEHLFKILVIHVIILRNKEGMLLLSTHICTTGSSDLQSLTCTRAIHTPVHTRIHTHMNTQHCTRAIHLSSSPWSSFVTSLGVLSMSLLLMVLRDCAPLDTVADLCSTL